MVKILEAPCVYDESYHSIRIHKVPQIPDR